MFRIGRFVSVIFFTTFITFKAILFEFEVRIIRVKHIYVN